MRKLSLSDKWFIWCTEHKKGLFVFWMAVGFAGFFGFFEFMDSGLRPHCGRSYGFYFAPDPQFTGSRILVARGRIPYRPTR